MQMREGGRGEGRDARARASFHGTGTRPACGALCALITIHLSRADRSISRVRRPVSSAGDCSCSDGRRDCTRRRASLFLFHASDVETRSGNPDRAKRPGNFHSRGAFSIFARVSSRSPASADLGARGFFPTNRTCERAYGAKCQGAT